MEYSDLYVYRIRNLCKERRIAINRLATMSDVKQSTLGQHRTEKRVQKVAPSGKI